MPTVIYTPGTITPTSVIGPAAAPATGRGVIVQLGKVTGVDLNAAAATTVFTTPASGFSRCVVTMVIVDNFSALSTTASLSFGSSGTPNDWSLTGTMQGADAGRMHYRPPNWSTSWTNVYGTGVAFVANVSTPQGSAATADVTAWGYYE